MIRAEELIVDNFAGGGGASTGIEAALGRPIDIAINHDPKAIAMHKRNHPQAKHLCENVWDVDPVAVTEGRPVGLAWFSPDCKHFSKAKGGKPVSQNIRGLAWIVVKWAELKRPRVIILENVEEFQDWGPLLADNRPDPARRGQTFRRWLGRLTGFGYQAERVELRACDYGTPTIRKRLVIVLRCDSRPIIWPDKTHGEGLVPYRSAAECINWSLPCPSIFLTRQQGRAIGVNRPLAEATMRRIARGVKRYVLDAAEPFIVNITHRGERGVEDVREPLRTVTASHRGEKALVVPFLGTYYGANREGGDRIASIQEPLRTQSTENRHALVATFLAQHNTGVTGHPSSAPMSTITQRGTNQALVAAFLARQFGHSVGHSAQSPTGTVVASGGGKTALVTSHIVKIRGTNVGSAASEPLQTISAGGTHHGEVRAFLMKYYGTDQAPQLAGPMHTVTSKDRLAIVMVQGCAYVITDIGMRMLSPRELYRAQGFPDTYQIDGYGLSKTAQVRMCGNSVCPQMAEAVVRAQFGGARREGRA